jgi:alkanesulfonate monooxygenase SsuD/methylene tetrahydromethanopterin reductase-like flavin-dependent oxidoreductase (luciferase family)
MMPLSLLDLAPVPAGGTAVDALAASVELAVAAEALGYRRFWVAEHHGIGGAVASTTPEVLVARIAAATTTLRVGSGVVLLGHQRPFRVAETFRTLHALFPGRIDLGVGRAASRAPVELALAGPSGRGSGDVRSAPPPPDPLAALTATVAYEDDLVELRAWLDEGFPPGHRYASVAVTPGVAGGPELWLMGSSLASGVLAARLGLRYCAAAFLDPVAAPAAVRAYRRAFRPRPGGPAGPWAALAVGVACGRTDEDGHRLRAPAELYLRRLADRDVTGEPLAGADEAVAELGGVPGPAPAAARYLSGGPATVRARLEEVAASCAADELVLHDRIADPADRLASYVRVAGAFAPATMSP